MAVIYSYPTKATLALGDLALISDSADSNKTKNATMSSIKDVIDVVDTFTNSFGTYVSGTANAAAKGAVSIGTLDLSAIDGTAVSATRFLSKDNTWDVPVSYTGGANLGFVPVGGTSANFLKGDGTWGTGAGGVTSVTAFTTSDFGKEGIVTTPTTGAVKVGIDILPLTDLSTGALGSDLLFVVDDPSGIPKNKKISIDNFFSTVGLITNSSINYTVKLPNTVGTANQILKLPSPIGTSPYQLAWADDTGGGGGSGTVTGTGTANRITKWSTGGTGIENSLITDFDNTVSIDKVTILKGDGTQNGVNGKLQLNCSANSHYVELLGPVHTGGVSYSLQFPKTVGTANQVLKLPASPGASNLLVWGNSDSGQTPNDYSSATISDPVASNIQYFYIFTCNTDFTISKMHWFQSATSNQVVTWGIYLGDLSSAALLGQGSATVTSTGVKVVTLAAESGKSLALTKGLTYVIAHQQGNQNGSVACINGLVDSKLGVSVAGSSGLPATFPDPEKTYTAEALKPCVSLVP